MDPAAQLSSPVVADPCTIHGSLTEAASSSTGTQRVAFQVGPPSLAHTVFGWFSPTSDTDPNPTGAFDYDAPGAWRFRLTAVKGGSTASVTVCIHTPGETCGPADADGDGVADDIDVCPDTEIPEADVPSRKLRTNRFALTDGDGIFDTKKPRGRGPRKSFTIEDTAGCSCEQIIEIQGLGYGHVQFGCSISAMEEWVELVNPE